MKKQSVILYTILFSMGSVGSLLGWDFTVYNHTPYDIYFMATFIGAAPNIKEGKFVIPAGSVGKKSAGWADMTGTVSVRTVNAGLGMRSDNNTAITSLNLNAANARLYGLDFSAGVALNVTLERDKNGNMVIVAGELPVKGHYLSAFSNEKQSYSQTYHVYLKYIRVGDGWQESLSIYKPSLGE